MRALPVSSENDTWIRVAALIAAPLRLCVRWSTHKQILVTCLGAYGDGLLFISFLQDLQRNLREHTITVVCSSRVGIILRRCCSNVRIIEIDYSIQKTRIKRLLVGLKIFRVNYAISINGSFRATAVSHSLHIAAKASRRFWFRIGQPADSYEITEQPQTIYSDLAETEIWEHMLLKYKSLLKKIVPAAVLSAEDSGPYVPLLEKEKAYGCTIAAELKGSNRKVVCLCHGARFRLKDWGWKNYAELMRKLSEKYDMAFILIGGKEDNENARMILNATKDAVCNVLNLTGETSVYEAIAIIKAADCCVGNDTFGLHAAIASETPSVAVMWGGDRSQWQPWGDENRHEAVFHELACFGCAGACIYPAPKCLEAINPQDVMDSITRVMR